MNIAKEFKEFVDRGNIMDLAVGVIIGASFGKVVSSLVNDVIMPPIGKLMGEVKAFSPEGPARRNFFRHFFVVAFRDRFILA